MKRPTEHRASKSATTKPGKYERRDINFISKKVLASYQPLLQAGRPNAVMVRYEAIASDPKGALEALARDTGLDLALDRIERPVGSTPKPVTSRRGSASSRAPRHHLRASGPSSGC